PLFRAANPLRVLVAAHVLLEPHPARGNASPGAVPDRARMRRADAAARHARTGTAVLRRARALCRAPRHPMARACRLPVRRLVLFLAYPAGAFPRHARSPALRGDEREHGRRRHPLLGAGARPSTEAAGAALLRRARGARLWRDVPADPARRGDQLLVAGSLSLL